MNTLFLNNEFNNYLKSKFKDVHLKELVTGGSITSIFRIIGIGVGYIFILLITRNFGAEGMGIFALSFTLLSVITVIGRLGFDMALLRFVSEYSSQDKWDLVKEIYMKAMKMTVPFCIFLSILLFLFSPYIAKYIFGKEQLSMYFRIISFAVLPLALKFMNSESLRGLKKIKEYSFFQLVSVHLFSTIFILGLLVFMDSTQVPIIAYSNSLKMRNILDVSFPMLLSSSMFLVMYWTDTIMLGIFRTEGEVGVYNVALKVAALTTFSLFAVNSIAAPKFAEFYGKGDMGGLERVVHHSKKMIFWGSFPVVLVFFLFPSFILGIFGDEFRTGVYAFLLLTFGQFIQAMSGSVRHILSMTGKHKTLQNITFYAMLINIVLNVILIPLYGINGAAFSSMVSMAFWSISSVVFIKKYFNIFTMYMPIRIRR
jgi:O-antigen/teichoic acid export membrane protein